MPLNDDQQELADAVYDRLIQLARETGAPATIDWAAVINTIEGEVERNVDLDYGNNLQVTAFGNDLIARTLDAAQFPEEASLTDTDRAFRTLANTLNPPDDRSGAKLELTGTGMEGVRNALSTLIPQYLSTADEVFNSGNYETTFDYTDAVGTWVADLNNLMTTYANSQELQNGVIRLDDGTVYTQADIDGMDPFAQAQLAQHFAQRNIDTMNAYNAQVDAIGLSEWQMKSAQASAANARLNANFQNKVREFEASLQLDQTRQNRAMNMLTRQLEGLAESRARADLVTDAKLRAAPLATEPGKTAFTGGDFGALAMKLAQLSGIKDPANTTLLNFPTTVTVDPTAQLAARDAQMGVGGSLVPIPELQTQASPVAPQLVAGPAIPPPTRTPLLPPALLPVPTPTGGVMGGLTPQQQSEAAAFAEQLV